MYTMAIYFLIKTVIIESAFFSSSVDNVRKQKEGRHGLSNTYFPTNQFNFVLLSFYPVKMTFFGIPFGIWHSMIFFG